MELRLNTHMTTTNIRRLLRNSSRTDKMAPAGILRKFIRYVFKV